MKRLAFLLAMLLTASVLADDALDRRDDNPAHVNAGVAESNATWLIRRDDGSLFGTLIRESGEIIPMGKVTIFGPAPPPPPSDSGQLICIRPWSCTLDESDADLTIRESLDAAGSKVAYISVLQGVLNQRMQPHSGIEAYRRLLPDQSRPWVFHVARTSGQPVMVHQGPLDAAKVLGWVGVPRVSYADGEDPDEEEWLDVDFAAANPELCGALDRREIMKLQNVTSIPGFTPIPKSEWKKWTERFPIGRLAKSIQNVTKQQMGSCVGFACANGMEAGLYFQGGLPYSRKISGMSMYKRIGRSANSGAYVPDAADELFERGILPTHGEIDINGVAYTHTHQQAGGWSVSLPSGWESTAEAFKAVAYSVTDEESLFRVTMDCRLREQIGRSSHSVSIFAGTDKGRWAYENSWGTGWGDYGKSIGYDGSMYKGHTTYPVLRDEIEILVVKYQSEGIHVSN